MDHARELLTHFSGPMGYLFFYLLVAACGCGFPFNSDITLICAAVLGAAGIFHFGILLILAFLAIMTGDSICFFVARKWGLQLLRIRPISWCLNTKNIERAEKSLETHGHQFLFIVRFLPLIRTALFFAAGALQIPPRSFYLMNGLATLIYTPVLMISSYYMASNIDLVLKTLKQFQWGLLAVCVIGLAAWILSQQKPQARNRK